MLGWCMSGHHEGHDRPCPGVYRPFYHVKKKQGRRTIEAIEYGDPVACDCSCHNPTPPPKSRKRKKK